MVVLRLRAELSPRYVPFSYPTFPVMVFHNLSRWRRLFPAHFFLLALTIATLTRTAEAALASMTLTTPGSTNVGAFVNTSSLPITFTVSSDSAYTEKWYKGNIEIVASTKYEMAAGTLRIRNITYTDEGHYQLRVMNASGTALSSIVWLRVLDLPPDPVIVTHPSSASLAYGASLNLSVQLASSGAYSYRWYKDGMPIPNAILSSYRVNTVTPVDAGSYHVVVSTPTISVSSNAAVITVAEPVPPRITDSLPNLSLSHGDYAQINVNVQGSPPFTFRLLRGGEAVIVQSSPYFYLSDVTATKDAGTYRVGVVTPHGSALSNEFTITVAAPVPPSITLQSPTTIETAIGGYLTLNAYVTGSNPMTMQWFKDGVPVKEGGSPHCAIANVTADHAGAYILVATNAAGSVISPPIVVSIPPPTPPEIFSYSWGSNVTTYVGDSLNLSYSNVTGTGPLTYAWFKDGVPLSSSGWSHSTYPVTAGDAGAYWLEVTSPYGSAIGEPFQVDVVETQSNERVLHAYYNGIVYAVAPNSALLRRYDIAAGTWLPSVSFGFVPSGLAVNEHGVFVGNVRALQRFAHDITGGTNVRNFSTNIREILAGTNHLFVATSDYVYPQIDTLDYTTFAIKGTFTATYSLAQNLALNADNTLLTGRNMGISPSGTFRLVVNADGTFGSILSSPYHGSYAVGNRFYFLNNGTKIAENSGIIYAADTLLFDGGVGGAFADLVETDPGRVIVARGRKATVYDDGVPGGQHNFGQNTTFLIRAGDDLLSFARSSSANDFSVAKVALSSITGEVPLMPVVSPEGRKFLPASAAYLDDLLYLHDRNAGNVHVFDAAAFAYLDSIALRDRASFFRLDPITGAMFTAYSDGTVWRLDAAAGLRESPLAILPSTPRALQPAGDVLFANDTSGAWSTNYTFNAITGTRLSSAEWAYQGTEYLWSPIRSRLYFIRTNVSPSDVNFVTINPDGTLGAAGDSPYHGSNPLANPLRMSPGGGLLLTGAGTMYDAVTLSSAGSIGNAFTDAVWTSSVITSIRESGTGTEVQQWNPNSYTLTTSRTLAGAPLRIFARDGGGFLVLVMHSNVPVPTLLDASLNTVASLIPLTADDVNDYADRIVALGSSVVLEALPGGNASGATFVWQRDGAVLAGMTSRSLDLGTLTADEVGLYSVAITHLGSTLTSNSFWVGPTPQRSYLINVSTRSYTEAGNKTLIMGFSLAGSGTKPLLARTSGPALTPFGVNGVLEDPFLRVFRGDTELLTNDNWQDPADYLAVGRKANDVSAFQFGNLSKDAALLSTFTPGPYTIHADSAIASDKGVVLAEIYDAHTAQQRLAAPQIVNLSARTEVRTGNDVLILGFVIAGNTQKRLLIRGIGPTLAAFSVPGVLPDAKIEVYQGDTLVAENDNWGGTAELTQAFAATSAFALDPASLDAAIVVTLAPGSYTAIVRGINNATGIALAELYDLD